MKSSLALLAVCLAVPCYAKDVTAKAAWPVLKRHSTALSKVIPAVTPSAGSGAQEPMSRKALILEFHRIFLQAKPSFSSSPTGPRKLHRSYAERNPDQTVQQALSELARYRLISPAGPIVTNKTDTMTPVEFGEAVAIFFSRVAILRAPADPKYTPSINS
jgi:hypothetical protein